MTVSYGEEIPSGDISNEWRLQIRNSSYVSVNTIDYIHTALERTVQIAPGSPIVVLDGQTISLETLEINSGDFKGYTVTLTLELI
jgi:hypothetical protein